MKTTEKATHILFLNVSDTLSATFPSSAQVSVVPTSSCLVCSFPSSSSSDAQSLCSLGSIVLLFSISIPTRYILVRTSHLAVSVFSFFCHSLYPTLLGNFLSTINTSKEELTLNFQCSCVLVCSYADIFLG